MVGYGGDVKGYRIFFSNKNRADIKRDIVFLQEGKENTEQLLTLEYDTNMLEKDNQDQISHKEKDKEGVTQSHEGVKAYSKISENKQLSRQSEEMLETSSEVESSMYLPCLSDEDSSNEEEDILPTRQRSTRIKKQT